MERDTIVALTYSLNRLTIEALRWVPRNNDAKADHFKPSSDVEEFSRKFFHFYLTKPSGLDEVLQIVSVTDSATDTNFLTT
jgi:hypothetical protein